MRGLAHWIVLLGAIPIAVAAPAPATPAIVGDARDTHCREALNLGMAAFKASGFALDWPIPHLSKSGSRIVLAQSIEDMSAGDAISADPREFVIINEPVDEGRGHKIFWAKRASAGHRLVVVDQPFNWEGDWYAIYVINSGEKPERFAQQLNARPVAGSKLNAVLGDNRWNPPLVLFDDQSKEYWIIDRGEPYDVLPDWKVYAIARSGLAMRCRIPFRDARRDGIVGMAPAVRELAAALDEALGSGTDEGTLQPTGRTRLAVKQGWANAAVRPWALSDEPYNARSEIDRGLADWARGNRRRAAVLLRIRSAYPGAQSALATYYAQRFKLDPAGARDLGRTVLDHMFRSYFVFSKSQ